ncbi:MAG TPA: hypothetical protein VFY29_10630 [Terriglobia bacterium]|nr:hypothetical protein [Terriglobia bacterium]
MSELIMTVQVTGIQKLAEAPSELSISFDDVYKTAGISSSPAWSVDRVIQFLENDRFRGKSRNEIQHELLAALAAEKVDVAGVIKEAISCDQALDAFAESIRKKRERWVAAKRAEIQQLERSLAEEEKDWKDWRERKRKREKDMALAVGYLIDKPVISIDDDAPAF